MKIEDVDWDDVQQVIDDELYTFLPSYILSSGMYIYDFVREKGKFDGDFYNSVLSYLKYDFRVSDFDLFPMLPPNFKKENQFLFTQKNKDILRKSLSLLEAKPIATINLETDDVRFRFEKSVLIRDHFLKIEEERELIEWMKDENIIDEKQYLHIAFGELRDLILDQDFELNLTNWFNSHISIDLELLREIIKKASTAVQKKLEVLANVVLKKY